MPELLVNAETWTRESHGLYDFEGTETQQISMRLKGSHRIIRNDSKISATQVPDEQAFEISEKALSNEDREGVIARCLYRDNSYWIYHKNLIDESADAVLEKKPEEKIWQVVKHIRQPEFEFPCYKIRKNDLVKVGRVRFKIRDLMSPVYKEINEAEDYQSAQFRKVYPSYEPSSVQDSLNNITDQSHNQDHPELIQQNPFSEDTDSEVDIGLDLAQNDLQQPDLGEARHDQNNIDSLLAGTGNALEMQRAFKTVPVKNIKKSKAKQNLPKIEEQVKSSKSEAPVCRICLMEDEEIGNPLISPCKCAGSMRFIHHGCLKIWFSNKRVVKSSNIVTTYFWKNLECELCKHPYPYETRTLDGREMLNIIEYSLPERSQNYLVLESISSNTSKVIHVVNMQNTIKLYIGRGHDAHVRVTDISVSRLHAVMIKSTQGYYYLSDNDSKFGTLALVRSPLQMLPDMKTQLQIGRSILTVEIRANIQNLIMQCFCASQKNSSGKTNRQEADQISLDGINYFPKEFASSSYLKLMVDRQQKQIRSLKRKESKLGQVHHHQTTQHNNESAALEDHVDQFINYQNELSQALLSAEERQGQNLSSSESDQEAQDFNGASPRSRNSQQRIQQDLSPDGSDESDQVDEDLNSEARQVQAIEFEQLELAIQQSLALHQQQRQQQMNESRTENHSVLEEQKIEEEKSQIRVEQNEESKHISDYQSLDNIDLNGKRQIAPVDELVSNISTSRLTHNPLYDLKSSTLLTKQQNQRVLLDNDYQDATGDQTILHDMPTQLVPKAKALLLNNNDSKMKTQRVGEQLNLTQKLGQNSVVQPEVRNASKTSRNVIGDIASQVIIEQGEELAEDLVKAAVNPDQIQTIEHVIPQSATEVQPNNLS